LTPLGGQDVGVVDLGELLGGEGLGWSENHVPGVVHDDVEPAALVDEGRRRSSGQKHVTTKTIGGL
jgi:hypothetical protein